MAADFHFTEPYLSKYIKKNTGKTFGELVREVRIKKSCILLKSTNLLVEDISNMIGYQSVEHFNRIFKNEFGITPIQYRNGKIDGSKIQKN